MCECVLDKLCANTSKSGGDIGCLLACFRISCSFVRLHALIEMPFMLHSICMCVCAQFQLCADRTSFFRSTISCAFSSLDIRTFRKSRICVGATATFNTHTPEKRTAPQSLLCAENHLRFPHFAVAFSLFHSLRQRNDKFPVFSCVVPANTNALHIVEMWKCVREIQNYSVWVFGCVLESLCWKLPYRRQISAIKMQNVK